MERKTKFDAFVSANCFWRKSFYKNLRLNLGQAWIVTDETNPKITVIWLFERYLCNYYRLRFNCLRRFFKRIILKYLFVCSDY